MHPTTHFKLLVLAASLATASCGGGGGNGGFGMPPPQASGPSQTEPPQPEPPQTEPPPPVPPEPEETRAQDARNDYAPAKPQDTTFPPLAADASDTVDNATTSRWAGMLNGAQYHVEVPADWNGQLVMYAHGYAGEGTELKVDDPALRRHLIKNGYAWAASSYSKNSFDARAGLEDTNALAAAFTEIAKANQQPLEAPRKIFIVGQSMGGLISAAAVEKETQDTANHKMKYDGAMSMCGVLADTELFDYYGAVQVTAQALAGMPKYPSEYWSEIAAAVQNTLFSVFKTQPSYTEAAQLAFLAQAKPGTRTIADLPKLLAPTATGAPYASIIKNLTGGERPMFDIGFQAGGSLAQVWGLFGPDSGTVKGILNKNTIDTSRFTYVIDGDPAASAKLNDVALKLTAATDANRLRRDGLRWVPKANGEFSVPVMTLQTLGDLRVPFSMQQIYQKRAADHGNAKWLVQRAIRGVSHCDFTVNEQVEAFDALVEWESSKVKPPGDDVLTPETVARPDYGCTFTRASGNLDKKLIRTVRNVAAVVAPCPPSP